MLEDGLFFLGWMVRRNSRKKEQQTKSHKSMIHFEVSRDQKYFGMAKT